LKKLIILLLFITSLSQVDIFGQSLTISLNSRYHNPLTTQKSPEYYNVFIYNPIIGGYFPINYSDVNNFSLAEGFDYGGNIGYKFNETLELGLDIHYFSIDKKYPGEYSDIYPSETEWELMTMKYAPYFSFGKKINKVCICARSSFIIAQPKLRKSYFYLNEYNTRKTMEFKEEWSYGYSFSLDFNYNISQYIVGYISLGVENIYYTPKEGFLIKSFTNNLENMTLNLREIYYSENINEFVFAADKPDQRITETVKLNSYFIGFGIKYLIHLNENY
jgi:hypothetical protein